MLHACNGHVSTSTNPCINKAIQVWLMHGFGTLTKLIPGHFIELGDNCIQIFHLGRYIVGYTVRNLVLRRCVISEHISDDIPPQIKILNMVISVGPCVEIWASVCIFW